MPELFANFKNAVNPGEFLSLDESLLSFKGRLSIKQYNPKKRARFGLKMFFLLDSVTDFALGILPYQGKATKILRPEWITEMGFGGAAVMTMLDQYTHRFHRVVVDNWFLSPTLATELKDLSTYVLGTVQKRRRNMPIMGGKLNLGEVEIRSNGEILVERYNGMNSLFWLLH